jgi:cell division protein FtsQ
VTAREGAAPGVVFGEMAGVHATGARTDAPVSASRSAVRTQPGRRRSLTMAACGVAVVCVATAWVTRSPVFALRQLHVSGTSHVSAQEVARLAGLDPRTNVLWLSAASVRRGLQRDPWIASAEVHRSLPGTVQIRITERRPVAMADPGHWLVAPDGVVVGVAPRGSRLPTIHPGVAVRRGARLSPLRLSLTIARTLVPSLRPSIAAVETRPGGQVVLGLRGGGVAVLGSPDDLNRKETSLEALLEWVKRRGISVGTIDVRVWTTPTLTPAST